MYFFIYMNLYACLKVDVINKKYTVHIWKKYMLDYFICIKSAMFQDQEYTTA